MDDQDIAARKRDDELVTLRQAAEECGLRKQTLRNYIADENDPLPVVRDDNGWIKVRRSDVRKYLERNPTRGRPSKQEPDRRPADDDAPWGRYYTLAEAAKASGYSQAAVRSMTKKAANPLPSTRNKDGWILVEQDAFWNYLENQGFSDESTQDRFADFAAYPELESLPGTYHSPSEISQALHIPVDTVRQWARDPANPVPHIKNGGRVYINKYKLPAFLASKEADRDFASWPS